MIKFIIGRAGSGKTFEIFSKIKEKLNNNQEIVLLVPEQFVFECEKALLEFCGAKSSLVKVFSFTKLCNNILNDLGGKKAEIIDESSKKILISLAIKQVKENLEYFKNCKISNSFCRDVAAIITVFKQANLSSDEIFKMSNELKEQNLSKKLYDFSLIMKAYESILEDRFLDSENLLDLAVEKSYGKNWFNGKTFFVDSFTGFTASQTKIIELIIKEAKEVYFSFCADNLELTDEINVFLNIKKEIESLMDIAKKYSVEISEPQIMNRKKNEELEFLENILSGETYKKFDNSIENVEICAADSKYSEIDYVAQKISLLVRENDLRYKDFAIISADTESYKSIISLVFSKYNIPCYIDNRTEIRNLPLVNFVLCLIKLSFNLNSETIFKMLKTELLNISQEEIADLEDYVYVWNIKGNKWLETWDMNPNGFEKSREKESVDKKLVYLNSIRQKIIKIILEFKNGFSNNATVNAELIYTTLKKLKIIEKLKVYSSDLLENGNLLEEKIQSESWDALINVLDRISKCYGNDYLSFEEYYDILLQNSIEETVGTVPQHIDEVIFGAADRIRTGFIKVAFLIGVNQGEFPSLNQPCGLLSTFEREKLIRNGVKIPDRSIQDIIENQYRFYNAACTPTEKVFFSFLKSGENGQASSVIDQIVTCMPNVKKLEYSDSNLPEFDEITAIEPLFEKTVRNINDKAAIDFKHYFENNEEFKSKLNSINDLLKIESKEIDKDTAEKLYKNNLYISASKIDNFYKCKFSYFCRYGLNLKTLNKAEISAVIRGTIAHYILEKVIFLHKDNICELTKEQAKIDIELSVEEYFREISVNIEDLSFEIRNNLKSIKLLILDLIMQIVDEFNLSDFKISECEVEIDNNGTVKPLNIPCENGKEITVIGKIDRVDSYVQDNKTYLRVIDYKTNSKVFELSDVLYGQNLQMLVYLYSLIENQGNNAAPAGILYLPIKKLSKEKERNKMNGLLLKDPEIIMHMCENPNEFLPAGFTSKGDFSSHSKIIDEHEFNTVFKYIKKKIIEMGNSLYSGDISVNPIDGHNSDACKYCEFKAVCKQDIGVIAKKVEVLKTEELLEKMKESDKEAII